VKGGVGKSTIAVNLAAGLRQMHAARPLLIDANLYFGDVPVLLDIAPKRSIFDLCDLKELDTITLKRVVTEHKSGISVLASPPDFTTVEMLNTETLINAISLYRSLFDYIVIDTRTSFDEATLQVLDVADRIVLVTTPEIGAVYQTARFLEVADALGYKDRVSLVVNRAGSGLDLKSVEDNIGAPIAASIVSAGRAVLAAGNHGKPLLLDDAQSKEKVVKDLAGLVRVVRQPMRQSGPAKTRSNKSLGQRVESLLRSVAL
jgi:pilus assembly protein CpaE